MATTPDPYERKMDETAPPAIQALLERLRQEFLEELPTRIDAIERLILAPGADGNDLCRQVHSLKGLGGTHGIDILAFACHQFEETLATTETAAPEARRDTLLAYVDILRRIQALGGQADQQAETVRQALRNLREGGRGRHTEILLVEPSAAMAALLQERLGSLPVRIDVTDDGLAALELYLHRRHDIVITAGEPRRLHGPALIAAIGQMRDPALCLLITADATVSKAASGGADHVLQRDRELPDRLSYQIARHIENAPRIPAGH